jgi:O-antigen ligase
MTAIFGNVAGLKSDRLLGRENLDYGKRRIGNGPELLLIPCIILAASGPIISSARGSALVMIGLLILAASSLMFMNVRSKFLRLSVSIALLVGLGTAYHLGWGKIEPRLINIFSDNMSNRTQIYETTLEMINDYGFFGSGPGSFEAISQFELGNGFTNVP